MTKKELRQQLRERMADLSPEELHRRSLAACSLLAETREFERAEIVLVFLSLRAEVDTTPLVLRAWRDGKRVLAPKVSWEERRMLPIEIRSLSDDVRESPLGLREPVGGMPVPVANIDLVVVPGLGFDRMGNRIGRGRGFYDRFLAHRDFDGVACGFAIECQVVERIPVGDHDVQVDMLVTDETVRRFTR